MPKRSNKVNKSQAIRVLLDQHPKAKAKDIVAALAKKQIAVQPGLVYIIKGRLAQMKSHKRKKAARIARAGQKTGSTDPVALILKIKSLAEDAGGIDNLKALVSVLAD
jgi:hypothetical protein